VLNRIPYVRGIDLAEAHELVKHDMAHGQEEVVGRAGRRAGRIRETGAVEKETENRR
jgi:hypothetical protein